MRCSNQVRHLLGHTQRSTTQLQLCDQFKALTCSKVAVAVILAVTHLSRKLAPVPWGSRVVGEGIRVSRGAAGLAWTTTFSVHRYALPVIFLQHCNEEGVQSMHGNFKIGVSSKP